MGEITQESHFEMLEKLPDGNYKAKYPKVKSKSGITFDGHLADNVIHRRKNKIYWTDTSTIVTQGTTYTKRIPTGLVNPKFGVLNVRTANGAGIFVTFTTDASKTYGIEFVGNSQPASKVYSGANMAIVAGYTSAVYPTINLKSVKIEGTDVVLVFENPASGQPTGTLSFAFSVTEVSE